MPHLSYQINEATEFNYASGIILDPGSIVSDKLFIAIRGNSLCFSCMCHIAGAW